MVAIKVLLPVDPRGQQRFAAEVRVLASLRHPNVVLFMGCAHHPYLAIVSEFMHRAASSSC
jgi:serine/threonine protein kinase